ncbi:response regulator [Myroides sp. LJL116]
MENTFNNFCFMTADDHSIITRSLSLILKDLYANSVVYETHDIAKIHSTLETSKIDLLILDICFQSGDILEVIPVLKAIQPSLKILIYSGQEEDIYALRCLAAGANGYLSKLSTFEETQNAIASMMNFGKYYSKNIQDKINDSFIFKTPSNPIEKLSNREFEIARLFSQGYGNTEICIALDLQKSTVSTYKTRIFEKLEISSITGLIQLLKVYKMAY